MYYKVLRYIKDVSLTTLILSFSMSVCAGGGVSVQGTRIIYPYASKQELISVYNSSSTDSFLTQIWVENDNGQKSNEFIVTPLLYLSGPGNENILRIIRVADDLPNDRESLYYFIAKAIPSTKRKNGRNVSTIRIAAATKIKLFVRPSGLTPAPAKAPSLLRFNHGNKGINVINPTPYFITLVKINSGNHALAKSVMIPPKSSGFISTLNVGRDISFSTINDFGALTAPITMPVN